MDRRLTAGAGAAALGLAWYFTSAAMTAVPVAFGAQPASEPQPVGVEQLDDHVFVRTVHVPAPRPPAGGVGAAAGRTVAAGAAAARTTSGAAPAQPAASTAVIAQPVAAPAAPAPTPKPVATTGGSTPKV